MSRIQYLKYQWKRGVIRAFYRVFREIGYYFSPNWIFNSLFLSIPNELIVETLTKFGASIGDGVTFMPPLHVHNVGKKRADHFQNLIIGSCSYIGPDLFLDLKDKIEIENNVTISMRVSLITHLDVGESPLSVLHFPPEHKPIIIKQGAYIGAGAFILMGVIIGECAVVGAGSVITKDVPPHSVVVGRNQIIRTLES